MQNVYGPVQLGIWYRLVHCRRFGVDCVTAQVYVGDPFSDHAQLDAAVHMSDRGAHRWAGRRIRELVKLTEACA